MKKLIVFLFFILPIVALSQNPIKFKRKYLGNYKGEIPGYIYVDGGQEIEVRSTPIRIEFSKDSVFVNIGNHATKGVYSILFAAKSYYLVECFIDGQLMKEKILVYKRGRKLSRDGIYPQPVAELKKIR